MGMIKKILLIILLIPSFCFADFDQLDWGKNTFIALHIIDTYQTIEAIDNPDFIEANPIIGNDKEDALAAMVFYGLGVVMLGDFLDNKYFYRTLNIIKFGVVAHNYHIGIRFEFK